ncbi:acyl-CoA carboxylase epsilon subunit [Sinomonas terrae]|uniref:Acyl-CoA carboxylase subunit epsilon n=1 Tax=Sinomonas terrae TaxID=2908838 RepID=A0ABS9U2X2_9MICC|nr:acyl-CoA carboxylase epsilon subunit [Sinomonas terrae]MCH6471043.1 acyl-CoA carboxylase subunit epsilon [Sinomonas terrae]
MHSRSGIQSPSATNDDGGKAAVDRSPLLSVTKGNPTPEELAALTAVLAAVGSAEPEPTEVADAPTRRERIRRATLRPRPMLGQRRGRF